MQSSPLAETTALSRRRPRARQRARTAQTLPDWVWGVAIGVFALAVFGAIFGVMQLTGGGSADACDSPLKPLNTSEISAAAFQDEDEALVGVAERLNDGNLSGAETAFYGPVHNFTHNADPPVREVDEALAKDLCRTVIRLEEDLEADVPTLQLSSQVQRLRGLLQDAAVALGFPRPR